jgi:hypothetical protein
VSRWLGPSTPASAAPRPAPQPHRQQSTAANPAATAATASQIGAKRRSLVVTIRATSP